MPEAATARAPRWRGFSVSAWVWTSPCTDGWLVANLERIRTMGFDAVELPVERAGDWDPERAAGLLEKSGLAASVCAAMSAERDLTSEDPHVVAETEEYVRLCVEAARKLGSRVVCGPLYASVGKAWRIPPSERRRIYERVAASLKRLSDYAGERGVKLAVEPINRFETSVLNTTEQALELIEAVDSEACGLLLDTFHMNIEEKDPAAAIRSAGARLFHLHASGTDRGAPGDDHADWGAIAEALSEAGYGGHVCIESFAGENTTIATAASIWRPLAPTQDELARRGLAFLRRTLGTPDPTTGQLR